MSFRERRTSGANSVATSQAALGLTPASTSIRPETSLRLVFAFPSLSPDLETLIEVCGMAAQDASTFEQQSQVAHNHEDQ
jgi:hypothetical protein